MNCMRLFLSHDFEFTLIQKMREDKGKEEWRKKREDKWL